MVCLFASCNTPFDVFQMILDNANYKNRIDDGEITLSTKSRGISVSIVPAGLLQCRRRRGLLPRLISR